MMSLEEALKELVGKRVVCSHDEGQKTAHSLIGIIESVDKDVLVIVTDFGVRNILPIKQILKIKEIGNEGVSK